MESTFQEDFSGVRAHLGTGALDARGARAMASADSVAFREATPPEGLVAHELAHVVQQRRAGVAGVPQNAIAPSGDASEREADRAAVAVARGASASISAVPGGAVSLSAKNPFDDPASWKDAPSAAKAMDAYIALPPADRRAAVATSYKTNIARVLRSLAPADQVGKYSAAVREITRWAEEEETRASSGKSDDQMATEQMKLAKQQAEASAAAAAAAKAPKGPPPKPTTAQVEAERKKQVESTSIPKSSASGWGALSPADQAKWTARGNSAVAKVVSHAKVKHPELALSGSQFRVAFADVESRGAGVVAFGEADGAGGTRAAVGFAFVTSVELNPAYVMDVVVHEVLGHPEYGVYGTEYHLALYDAAMAKMPGYSKPAPGTPARTSEIDAYAYQETEMFAVLRSMPYRTGPTAADAGKVPQLDTQGLVTWHVGLMKKQWAPTLIVPILRGFRRRLLIDPRITAAALGVFDNAVLATFNAAMLLAVQK